MGTVVCIDIGTTGAKAGTFDLEGRCLALAGHPYSMSSSQRGWLEQAPSDWWSATQSCLNEITQKVASERPVAVCVVGQNPTLVALDNRGQVVRPAITWGDRRAGVEARQLSQGLGRPIDASLNLPKVMWLRDHATDEFEATATFLQSFDYLNFKLTGQLAAVSPLPPWLAWNPADIEAAQLPARLFPRRSCRIGDRIGQVSSTAAMATGLPAGTPVIAGLVDGIAACLGTGAVQTGDLYFGSGTTSGVNLCWPQAVTDDQGRFGSIPYPLGERWLVGGPTSTGSKFFDWFARQVCREDVIEVAREVASEAAVPATLVARPYLLGERTPLFDPLARGVFFGLSEAHSRADLGQAVMEAVCFAVRDVMEILEEAGLHVSLVRTGGGAAQSQHWNQIKCNVLGKPLVIPEVVQSGLLGAAMAAAWGIGHYASGEAAVSAMFRSGTMLEPNPTHHSQYTRVFRLYRRLYRHLREDFAQLTDLVVEQEEIAS